MCSPMAASRRQAARSWRSNSRSRATPNTGTRQRNMNVAIMKTKAEQAIAESFEAVAEKLPGNAAVKARRTQAIGVYGGLGLPHRRVEEWKYTDLRANVKDVLPAA